MALKAHIEGFIFECFHFEPTHNQKVPGSSPGGPTKSQSLTVKWGFCFLRPMGEKSIPM